MALFTTYFFPSMMDTMMESGDYLITNIMDITTFLVFIQYAIYILGFLFLLVSMIFYNNVWVVTYYLDDYCVVYDGLLRFSFC